MTKIISIANQKGGVGKTTTTINLATSLSAINKKVLIIDADPQGNASTGLGIPYEDRSPNLYELITNRDLELGAIKETQVPNLNIITSNTNLAAAEVELANVEKREFVLDEILNKTKNFDFILIDCPPALGFLTINSLVASSSVIVPLNLSSLLLKAYPL